MGEKQLIKDWLQLNQLGCYGINRMNLSLSELKSQIYVAMQTEKLTAAQKVLLNKCPKDWAILPVGCTNKTLLVLEKKNFVETRIAKHPVPELSRWEWRRNGL